MILHPEVSVTPDCPTVRIREARESVDLDIELPKILKQQGWTLGTYFNLQFISHDRTELLSACQYVVTEDKESIQTSGADTINPRTSVVSALKAEPMGEWKVFKKDQPKKKAA